MLIHRLYYFLNPRPWTSMTIKKVRDKAGAFIGFTFCGLVTQSIENERQNDNQTTTI